MPKNHIATVIAEALVLTLVLTGTAATTFVFQHAALGLPMLASAYQPLQDPAGNPLAARLDEPKPESPAATSNSQTLPTHVFLKVPFTTQAPFGDWSDPFGEACEEASVAMAMAWVTGKKLTPQLANDEILGQVAYENYNFGYNHDTALKQTLKLFTDYYRYRDAEAVYDISLEDIKKELASGNLVIVPLAGTLLNNPYYAVPPPYHMLVIRGYDDVSQEFITNDPGTRRGESYRYAYKTILNAIHDWTGDEATLHEGRKGMIVVRPVRSKSRRDVGTAAPPAAERASNGVRPAAL